MALHQSERLLSFLKGIQAHPKKSLSQNFLQNKDVVEKILKLASPEKTPVLEIGPGPGVITEALLKKGHSVIAIETDTKFAKHLRRLEKDPQKLQIFHEDFLKFDLNKLPNPIRLIANLPYHLTAPILQKVCEHSYLFTSATFMVQKEVALRICASSGTKAYGRLSVFIQFFSTPQLGFFVSNDCFYPSPEVDSAVVKLQFKTPSTVDKTAFFKMIKQCFQMKRKKLTNNLKVVYPVEKILSALKKLDMDLNVRAEDLSVEQFLKLFDRLEPLHG